MNIRLSKVSDLKDIMGLIEEAKEHLKSIGADQWQDGYPNEEVILLDISEGTSYVLEEDGDIIGTVCIQLKSEPVYDTLEGNWLLEGKYTTIHRIAVSNKYKGKGYASKLFDFAEEVTKNYGYDSIRSDTQKDNYIMKKILKRQGYTECGTVVYFGNVDCVCFEKVMKY